MTKEERIELAKQPIVWTGNTYGECAANWAGLLLRTKWVDNDYFWWAIYDMQKGELIIDKSDNYPERYIGWNISKEKAEKIAREYLDIITTKAETAKYLMMDVFSITGRGLIFTGNLTEGSILIGDTIEFVKSGELFQRKIIGVEMFKTQEASRDTGLLIKCKNEAEINELRNWKPSNIVAIIYQTSTTEENQTTTNNTFVNTKRTWWQKLFGKVIRNVK